MASSFVEDQVVSGDALTHLPTLPEGIELSIFGLTDGR
jgi:hypothetical protein